MKTPSSIALGLALVLGLMPAAFGGQGAAEPRVDRRVQDCEEATPEVVAVTGVTDDGAEVALDVMALLDGVDRTAAKAVFETAARAYAPLAIEIVPRYRSVAFPADEVTGAGDEYAQPANLIARAKELLGPTRPKGIDVIFIMTNKDLGTEVDPGVSGYADCIGGIRYPDRSYAVGEMREDPISVGLTLYGETAAKVLAHEVGHLLGARHEHQDCAEGVTQSDVDNGEATPCTIMMQFIELQSLNFGTLEGAVVRGHATRYAAP